MKTDYTANKIITKKKKKAKPKKPTPTTKQNIFSEIVREIQEFVKH